MSLMTPMALKAKWMLTFPKSMFDLNLFPEPHTCVSFHLLNISSCILFGYFQINSSKVEFINYCAKLASTGVYI